MGIGFVVVGTSDAVEEFFVRQVLHKGGFEVGCAKIFAGVRGRAVSPMTTRALRLINSFGLSQASQREERTAECDGQKQPRFHESTSERRLIRRAIVARLATGRAVVQPVFAEPDIDLALASAAILLTGALLFRHFALHAKEFLLGSSRGSHG